MRAPGSTQCFTLCRFLPGSTQCFTSCRFLVDNKLGSCTLFLCFNNLPLRCNFCHLGHSSHFHITKPCKDFPSAAKQSQCSRQYNGAKNDQRTSLSLEKYGNMVWGIDKYMIGHNIRNNGTKDNQRASLSLEKYMEI